VNDVAREVLCFGMLADVLVHGSPLKLFQP
jgi:hypothetical protein